MMSQQTPLKDTDPNDEFRSLQNDDKISELYGPQGLPYISVEVLAKTLADQSTTFNRFHYSSDEGLTALPNLSSGYNSLVNNGKGMSIASELYGPPGLVHSSAEELPKTPPDHSSTFNLSQHSSDEGLAPLPDLSTDCSSLHNNAKEMSIVNALSAAFISLHNSPEKFPSDFSTVFSCSKCEYAKVNEPQVKTIVNEWIEDWVKVEKMDNAEEMSILTDPTAAFNSSQNSPEEFTKFVSDLSNPYTWSFVYNSEGEFSKLSVPQQKTIVKELIEEIEMVKKPLDSLSNIPPTTELEWHGLEILPQEEQTSFLLRFTFKDVPVCSEERNVKRGDHIFFPCSLVRGYNHHSLVNKVDGNDIEYFDYNSRGVPNPLSRLVHVGKAQTTFEELEAKQAMKRIWPHELERYDDETVIKRAESQETKGDKCYNMVSNNCEHFVNWCKCGLSTSMQVTRREIIAYNGMKFTVIGTPTLILLAMVAI